MPTLYIGHHQLCVLTCNQVLSLLNIKISYSLKEAVIS